MADGFRIPFQEAESEFVEKRSRFISHVWRVETEEEAQEIGRASCRERV